jgi:hypothetical protein
LHTSWVESGGLIEVISYTSVPTPDRAGRFVQVHRRSWAWGGRPTSPPRRSRAHPTSWRPR